MGNYLVLTRFTYTKAPFRWQKFWGEIPVALSLLFGKIYPIID
jgi:hypothetical protein